VWGEDSLELEKARGNFLGERAMVEAVGWVGGISFQLLTSPLLCKQTFGIKIMRILREYSRGIRNVDNGTG
jgi:hypothetical protein